MSQELPPNVYMNGEYGQITVDIPFKLNELDCSTALAMIETNLKSIKKIKSFIFYLSVPGHPFLGDPERVVNINGHDYVNLRGTIKPCRTQHGVLLGYDCSFMAVLKASALNSKDAYNPANNGLSPIAKKQLELELSEHLIAAALQSKQILEDRAIDLYLTHLHKSAKLACEQAQVDIHAAANRMIQAQKIHQHHVKVLEQVESVVKIARKSRSHKESFSPAH